MTARTPQELHMVLATAFSWGDLDAFVRAYEPDATLIVPPEGKVAHGRAEIHRALEPLFAGGATMRSDVVSTIESGDLALTQARWVLVGTGHGGEPLLMSGRGAIVSRRQPDGSWLIVLDNPITPD